MNGIQTAKRLTAERPGLCVLLMSGSLEDENPGLPLLRKPFGVVKLSETVKGLLPACQKSRKRA
jgi:hypothetical protein